ncbi:MAG: large conductance mechanosensitive channel protein MscL [Eubacteriales bacterium]
MKKFFEEFKTFISKGNVVDLAVGVIVGGMFTKIVNSFTNDIIMPFVSILTGKTSFENMFFVIKDSSETAGTIYKTLEEAKAAGATIVAYGNLIQLILDFLITAFCLFLIVKGVNKLNEVKEKAKKKELDKTEKAE